MTLSGYCVRMNGLENLCRQPAAKNSTSGSPRRPSGTLNIAASAAGRSVSEFVLESALARAEETLADRRHFGLDAERWEAFMAALEAPPREIPALERLMREPSLFESHER